MSFLNDKTKTLRWYNRNFIFLGTILVVVTNILLFYFPGNNWGDFVGNPENSWTAVLFFDNVARLFLNSFVHADWQHVLLNMACFFVVGIYLERKKGTINLFLLVLVMALFTSLAVGANHQSIYSVGFSGVIYGLYAYVFVDFFFMLRKETRTKFNIFSGIFMFIAIYVAMCFSGGTESFCFEFYPYDLITNMGHYTSFAIGIVVALCFNICKVQAKAQPKEDNRPTIK